MRKLVLREQNTRKKCIGPALQPDKNTIEEDYCLC